MRLPQLFAAGVLAASTFVPMGALAQTATSPRPVDAKIEIVFPHDQQGNQAPVAQAPLVNVEVYLFQRGTLDPVGCGFSGSPALHFAQNWEIFGQGHGIGGEQNADEIAKATPQKIIRTVNGKTFPVWVFNDVPVGPFGPYITNQTHYFFVDVPGYDARSNVWGHGADPRTFQPSQTIPQSTASQPLSPLDAIIQIVWPHDRQGNQAPVASAPLANVSVDLFRYPLELSGQASLQNPTTNGPMSVAPNFSPAPELLKSLNTGYLDPVGQPAQEIQETNSSFYSHTTSWPRWNFNDVDVSAAATDPTSKYYFLVRAPGVETHATVWAHGADPRTYFPQRDIPTSSGVGC